MTPRIRIDTQELDWRPAGEVMPGFNALDGTDARVLVKVLRRPLDGGGCWHWLIRFIPPEGQAIRVNAVAESDEEIFYLSGSHGDGDGVYGCNPAGLRHGVTVTEETTALVHYHGAPDRILRAELIDVRVAS
jgi:hypothetical protein